MKIKWNGHSSFTIVAADGTTIITDPYEPGGYGGAVKYGPIPDKADIVTVSHDHADHAFVEGLVGEPLVVKDSQSVRGLDFKAIPAYHDNSDGSERGGNNIFVFTVDGIKICHLGDLGHELNQKLIGEIGEVDVLLLPIGGMFTIDPNQATRAMKELNPKIVIPMHYKTEKCGFPLAVLNDFTNGKDEFVEDKGTSEVSLTSESLGGKQEIWLLTHAC